MTLGERIKKRRTELGLSQAELATLLDYGDRSTIAKIESGKNDLTQSKIVLFADTLETTPSYLMGWTDDPYDYDKDPDARLAQIPIAMFDHWHEMGLDAEQMWKNWTECCDDAAKQAALDSAMDRLLPPPAITKNTVTFPVVTSVAAHYGGVSDDESVTGETVEVPDIYLKGRKPEEFCAMRVRGDSMYPDFRNGDVVLVLKQTTMNHSGEIGVISYGADEMTIKRINYVEGEDWLELVPLNPSYPPTMIEGVDLESCHVIGIPRVLIREF